jgi:cytochrome c oxidase subunit 3
MSSKKTHPYHLVEPSPWPFVGSVAAFLCALGLILYIHDFGLPVLLIGLASVLFTMYGWWKDVIKESTSDDIYTPPVQHGLRMGMVFFIASEVMFFVAFFWAFFNASLFPPEVIGGVWPPKGLEVIDPFDFPYLNTLILLLSGTAITWAHQSLMDKDNKAVIQGLGITIILGTIFTCVQAYEYVHATFAFKDNIYTSTFYMATGFHGSHVIIGTLFLIVCWFRARQGEFTPKGHIGFEAAAWYWHFVDVVWLFLFVCIYWWGSGL